jgi:hypothetical protein
MPRLHWLLRVALFAAAAAACVAAALQLREQRATVERTADDIEGQLNELDPATRAAVLARLSKDAEEAIKARVRP